MISNAKLYKLTNAKAWSKTTEILRQSWINHLMQLDPEVPARKALTKALKPEKVDGQRQPGYPKCNTTFMT